MRSFAKLKGFASKFKNRNFLHVFSKIEDLQSTIEKALKTTSSKVLKDEDSCFVEFAVEFLS